MINKLINKFFNRQKAPLASTDIELLNLAREKSNSIPKGYSVQDRNLFFEGKRIDLPGSVWSTSLVEDIFVVTCHPDSCRDNVLGFDLKGKMLWRVAPVPYGSESPAYQGISVGHDFVTIISSRGGYEFNPKTGAIGKHVDGPGK